MSLPIRAGILAAMLAAVLIFPSAGSAASTSRPGCKAKGSKTVVATKIARVYVSADGNRLVGCLRKAPGPLLLENLDDPNVQIEFDNVTLSGRYAGWHTMENDQSCKADCPPGYDGRSQSVNVASLRRRTQRSVRIPALAATPANRTKSLRLSAFGAIAWLTPGSGDARELRVSARTGDDRVLDSGDVDIKGFRGSLLLWTQPPGFGRWIDTAP